MPPIVIPVDARDANLCETDRVLAMMDSFGHLSRVGELEVHREPARTHTRIFRMMFQFGMFDPDGDRLVVEVRTEHTLVEYAVWHIRNQTGGEPVRVSIHRSLNHTDKMNDRLRRLRDWINLEVILWAFTHDC